ncbi:MAG: hypothetical protein ACR2KX_13600 [Chitinophagaceae bacterium]
MKNFLIILFVLSGSFCQGQTYEEWFRQKKTQEKYLLEQIAALQTYIGYAEKGYSIVIGGLNTIKNIKHGDFNLHNNFFSSLSSVKPAIKKYSKVASIIAMQISIAKQVSGTIKSCKKSNMLMSSELKYLSVVFNNLLGECAKNLDELFALITNNESQMKDDERIQRIDKVYDDMKDKQVFVTSFSHSAKGLSIQRINDHNDIIISKKLHGL